MSAIDRASTDKKPADKKRANKPGPDKSSGTADKHAAKKTPAAAKTKPQTKPPAKPQPKPPRSDAKPGEAKTADSKTGSRGTVTQAPASAGVVTQRSKDDAAASTPNSGDQQCHNNGCRGDKVSGPCSDSDGAQACAGKPCAHSNDGSAPIAAAAAAPPGLNAAQVSSLALASTAAHPVTSGAAADAAPARALGPPGGLALVERIEPSDFDWVNRKFREFFAKRGMIEVPTQSTVDILSACEDTQNLASFIFADGLEYPLKQTGQMVLEHELLSNPNSKGFFCQTTSYRFEKNPKPGRHSLIFPMMEFEIHGGLDTLIQFERDLLEHFGFGKGSSFPQGDYLDVCDRYKTAELDHEHEARLQRDFGPVFFLTNFPESTSPFWNMKRDIVARPAASPASPDTAKPELTTSPDHIKPDSKASEPGIMMSPGDAAIKHAAELRATGRTRTTPEDAATKHAAELSAAVCSGMMQVSVARKCDVIMDGIETIGSAERSCDPAEMRARFYSIMNGQYAKTLFDRFGKARVERELEDFLKHNFFVRSGAGIGITRMIRACKAAGFI
jgi:hypothetical protein